MFICVCCVLKEICGPVRLRCSELTAPPKVRGQDLSGSALQLKMKLNVFFTIKENYGA